MKLAGSFIQDKRLRAMLLIAVIITAITLALRLNEVAYGVLAATPVGIFNYWIIYDALKKGESISNASANKMFIGRFILRMAISLAALVLAMQVGIYFIFGVLLGLFLHLFTYSLDVWKILTGKSH